MSKKNVSATMEQVKALPHNTQVDLLAQALLREYMHRKSYKKTLHMFDQECPRDGNTISSRQVMNDALALQQIQEENKALTQKTATNSFGSLNAFDTIMDVLCWHRVCKKKRRTNPAEAAADARILQFESSEDEDEKDKSSKAEQHAKIEEAIRRAKLDQEARAASLRKEMNETVENLRSQIAAEAAKVEKFKAKRAKLSGVKDGENSKKKGKDDAATEAKGSSSKKKSSSAILSSAIDTVSSLPVNSVGSARGRGAGQSWTPGGSDASAAPSVGLNTSAALSASLPSTSSGPASFYAGAGMHLMADRPGARGPPVASVSSSSSSPWDTPRGGAFARDDDVPSPYAKLGATPYDPQLQTKGVLARSSGASPTDQRSAGRSFPNSGSNSFRQGSPESAGAPLTTELSASVSIGSPFAGHAAAGRKSRRVTIIAD